MDMDTILQCETLYHLAIKDRIFEDAMIIEDITLEVIILQKLGLSEQHNDTFATWVKAKPIIKQYFSILHLVMVRKCFAFIIQDRSRSHHFFMVKP